MIYKGRPRALNTFPISAQQGLIAGGDREHAEDSVALQCNPLEDFSTGSGERK